MSPVKYHKGKFPPTNLDWPRLLPLIGPANAAVARYEGMLHGIPNAHVLLSPLTSQEAVLSSRIEGTQATLGEVLEFEAAEDTASGEKRNDIQEVINYRKAMQHAVSMLEKLPLSQRVVRKTHEVLMQGVRGQNRAPGKYRRIQNWIGPNGCTAEQARFLPPNAQIVPDLMSAWEKYLHSKVPDKLVQLAILHVEFEAIHPFLDGNGRIGRLLVPLFLVSKKILSSPDFYISEYLEAKRELYYDRLHAVSFDGDWTGWCVFFLKALTEQAKNNEIKAKKIQELYESKKSWIVKASRSRYAVNALDWFFNRPIFKTPDFKASADIPQGTAHRIIKVAQNGGLLRELRPASGRRPALFIFPELLNIAEGLSVF